jgi:hypothetical protein
MMKLLQIRKNLFCMLIMLAVLLSFFGICYADNGGVQVNLTSPSAHQVYKLGEIVEISGTAQGVAEVSVVVRNALGGLMFTAQPKVVNNVFATNFTLEPGNAEGKYTILVSCLGLPKPKTYSFTVSDLGGAVVELTKPSADAKFKAGDVVEIAGTAQNVSTVAIYVRNSKDGGVYVAQPSVVDGKFKSKFTLPANAVTGEYSVMITGAGLAAAQTYHFTVISSGGSGGGGGTGSDNDPILYIKGNGVKKEVSYTRAQLEAMDQKREMLSATSDYPQDLVVAVEGVFLRSLLEEAGLRDTAQMIIFEGTDGYTAKFTIDELFNQKRYIFPEKKVVEPIIALQREERAKNFNNMSKQDTPVVCYGQRAKTEQTLMWFVKRLETIEVTTDNPDTWPQPTAKIIIPGSKEKVDTQGGRVKKGSEIYLTCSEPVAKIYYTTDGTTPDLDSKIFNLSGCGPLQGKDEPITINTTTTVKAMSVGRGRWDSKVATFTFTVDGSPGGGSSGGGTPVTQQPVDETHFKKETLNLENGRKGEKITLQADTLIDIEKGVQGSRLAITSTGNVDEVRVEVPSAILQKAKEKSMLLGFNSQIGNYTLPLSSLNIDGIAAELGVKPEEISLNIVISQVTEDVKNKLGVKVQAGQQMLTDPVEFRVELNAPNGKKVEYKSFGTAYVEREIPLNGAFNINQATGVVWNEAKGKFLPLPTRFETKDGKNIAVILNRSNSLYTVLQSGKTFADIKGHWAQGDIELLASKMLINGKSETAYVPGSNITRAEFAALLVRALGLQEGVLKEGQFKDVAGTAWYAGSVAAATNENIIKGYDGKLFKPNENITREEMAVMISRASRVAGKDVVLSGGEQEQQVALFKDKQKISSWAVQDVALAVKAGIINGMPGGNFAPQTNADRAQSAVILKRFLTYANFIATH